MTRKSGAVLSPATGARGKFEPRAAAPRRPGPPALRQIGPCGSQRVKYSVQYYFVHFIAKNTNSQSEWPVIRDTFLAVF